LFAFIVVLGTINETVLGLQDQLNAAFATFNVSLLVSSAIQAVN